MSKRVSKRHLKAFSYAVAIAGWIYCFLLSADGAAPVWMRWVAWLPPAAVLLFIVVVLVYLFSDEVL